ncbi:MAG: hypothetical protein ACAI25_11070 [Planctomycetota bacterium]
MRSRAIVFASLVLLVAPFGLSARPRHRHHRMRHVHVHTLESPLERLAR